VALHLHHNEHMRMLGKLQRTAARRCDTFPPVEHLIHSWLKFGDADQLLKVPLLEVGDSYCSQPACMFAIVKA
jgi:hypothetical protein